MKAGVLVLTLAVGIGPAAARPLHHSPPVPTFLERFTSAFSEAFGSIAPKAAFATYYGGSDGLCGSRLASGGRFDCKGMSAAHRTLPLGSHAYVCGRAGCERLLINDRGPYANGADLDLSPAAVVAICGALTSCHVRFWPLP